MHVIFGACILIILYIFYVTGNSSQVLVWLLFFPVKACYLVFFSLLHLPQDQSILAGLFLGAPINASLWIFAFEAHKSVR
jgi:membrane-bound acyltransferase YfiQ involved in biofilm formation